MLHEVLDKLEQSLIIFAADAFGAVVVGIAKFDSHHVRPVVLPGVHASLDGGLRHVPLEGVQMEDL